MNAYFERRACVKCDFVGASTEYDNMQKILRRTCGRCGHVWYELPKDSTV